MKIGIFAGMERAFPAALIERLRGMRIGGETTTAELVKLGAVREAPPKDYDLIVDRISHEINFYRVYCKVAALAGTYVVNDPFWFSADDKFFGYSLARRLGIPVPKTVILPSKSYPPATTPHSFRNLVYPLDWDAIFSEIGFPAFLKQHMGGGWANVYKVHDPAELFRAYDQTGELVMMLQEAVDFEQFVRCLVIGRRHVLPIRYDPAERRYHLEEGYLTPDLEEQIVGHASRITAALGYDMNSAEFAIRDGVPYAIDFTNPGPDFDPSNIHQRSFDWVVERFTQTVAEILEGTPRRQPLAHWRELVDTETAAPPNAPQPARPAPVVLSSGSPAGEHPLAALVGEYNRILEGYRDRVPEISGEVQEELARRRIMYGGEVARTFLRPSFLTASQFRQLEHACNVLIGSVNTILTSVFDGDIARMGSSLGITPEELELTVVDPGYPLQVAINRMDAFSSGDRLTFLEFNCDSPAGIAYGDELAEVIGGTPFFRDFAARHRVSCPSGRDALLAAFRRIYRDWGGRDPLRIAIIDWRGIATSPEFELFRTYFTEHGVPCVIADPREAEYDGRRLSFGGEPVTFVYKRVITSELLAKRDEAAPFLAAYRGRAACFANSFRSRLADNKVIFSLLSDPDLAHHFSAEERAVAAATIPWTRRVTEGRTRVDGVEVDLVEHLRAHREELVLKPNTDYGGRNVTIGSEASPSEWDDAIGRALAADWVVQRRVEIPEEPFPVVADQGLTFEPRKVNINPFALGGSYGGCVSRLSTQSIINVRVGGGAVPLFVVEE